MKKYIYKLGFSLLAVILLFSCYEDEGNYDYNWIPEVDIQFTFTDTAVGVGQQLYVEPILSQIIDNGKGGTDVSHMNNLEDFSFRWSAWTSGMTNFELSNKQVLDTTIQLPIRSQSYRVACEAIHKTGVVYRGFFNLRVVNRFTDGYIIMTEDEDNMADIEIYGREPNGEFTMQRNVLLNSGFPYLKGPQFAKFHAASINKRIWVSTVEGFGYLDMNTYSYPIKEDGGEPQSGWLMMMGQREEGFYFKHMVDPVAGVFLFMGNDGGAYMLNNNMLIFPSIGTIPPAISPNGQYENIEIYPALAGSLNSYYVWDNTYNRMLLFASGSTETTLTYLKKLPEDQAFSGWKMITMSNYSSSQLLALMKNPEGRYTYINFAYNTESQAWQYNPQYTKEWDNTNGLFDRSEHAIFTCHSTNSFYYFSVGNKLYVYREGRGCVEVNVPGVNFDNIVLLTRFDTHEELMGKVIVATYEENKGGNVYVLDPDLSEPVNLTLHRHIAETGKVKSISYFY